MFCKARWAMGQYGMDFLLSRQLSKVNIIECNLSAPSSPVQPAMAFYQYSVNIEVSIFVLPGFCLICNRR